MCVLFSLAKEECMEVEKVVMSNEAELTLKKNFALFQEGTCKASGMNVSAL